MILNFTSDFPPSSTPALPGNGKGQISKRTAAQRRPYHQLRYNDASLVEL